MEIMDKIQTSVRRLSRRRFAFGAAALATIPCSSVASFGQEGTPKKGGRFRVGVAAGATTDSLDPATYNANMMVVSGYALRNNLTEVNGRNELVPELAESWEASKDAATWTFKLRDGVEFHNGKTLVADDVVASINHHRGPDSKSGAKSLLDSIRDVRSDGKDVVVVELTSGNADLPFIFYDFHLGIMPADSGGKADWQSGVGTGPYSLGDFKPGVQTSLRRNSTYWKAGHAHFDEADVLYLSDATARTNALQTGQIHLMDQCDLATLNLLQSNPEVDVEEVEGRAHAILPMRTDTAPFDNNDVRLALKYGIDRRALIDTVFSGHAAPGNDHPINSSYRYFDKSLAQREYDPERARFHLQKAGLSGLKVDLNTSSAAFAGAVDASLLYKEQAAKAGIDINVVRQPVDGYWDNIWLKAPWCVSFWSGRATEDLMFSVAYAENAAWNDTFWKNQEFNARLIAARTELDESKRRALYAEMQMLLSEQGGAIIPAFLNFVTAKRKNVMHGPVSNVMDLDACKAIERWWFA